MAFGGGGIGIFFPNSGAGVGKGFRGIGGKWVSYQLWRRDFLDVMTWPRGLSCIFLVRLQRCWSKSLFVLEIANYNWYCEQH